MFNKNEIARTILISAVISAISGLIAFGGAVLYLGDDEPAEVQVQGMTQADVVDLPPPLMTRAEVQGMINAAAVPAPSAGPAPSLTRAEVQGMIDAEAAVLYMLPDHQRAEVQHMVDTLGRALRDELRAVDYSAGADSAATFNAVTDYAFCLVWHLEVRPLIPSERACWDEAVELYKKDKAEALKRVE